MLLMKFSSLCGGSNADDLLSSGSLPLGVDGREPAERNIASIGVVPAPDDVTEMCVGSAEDDHLGPKLVANFPLSSNSHSSATKTLSHTTLRDGRLLLHAPHAAEDIPCSCSRSILRNGRSTSTTSMPLVQRSPGGLGGAIFWRSLSASVGVVIPTPCKGRCYDWLNPPLDACLNDARRHVVIGNRTDTRYRDQHSLRRLLTRQ